MNYISMKSIKATLLMVLTIFVISSCEDEDKAPIVTFDTAGKAAYPRLVTEGDKLVNILSAADFAASSYVYTIEFVDQNGGMDVVEYILELEFDDNDDSNGDLSVSGIEILRVPASGFTLNADGFPELANITVTASDIAAATGVTFADLTAGDNFRLSGRIVMNDGAVFSGDNASATIVGGAFRGRFDFTLPVGCPSDLRGTFDFTTTVNGNWGTCTDDMVLTGTVDIIKVVESDEKDGRHEFSDWSFGAYTTCYAAFPLEKDEDENDIPYVVTDVQFTETCTVVDFTTFLSSLGDVYTLSSTISGNDWTIVWSNTFGEGGTTTITFPGGVPFTLAP